MPMKVDVLIKNGHVIDPRSGVDEVRNVVIKGRRIIDAPEDVQLEIDKVVDAEGCYVVPGLVDYHTHMCYSRGVSVYPDLFLPTGVTTAVDAGSTGCANFDNYYKALVCHCLVRTRAFLSIYGGGMVDNNIMENFDPALIKFDNIERIFDKYADHMLGLKVRVSRDCTPDLSILELTLEMAEKLGTRVCVHTTDPAGPAEDIASMLRKDDIFAHVFQGRNSTILNEEGQIKQAVLDARERGVVFDAANGHWNYNNEVGIRSVAQGFLPDIISTDQTFEKVNYRSQAKNLPYVMSKYLDLGMSLHDVIKASTQTPAFHMGLDGEIGTLAAGAVADVAVLRLIDCKVNHRDDNEEVYEGSQLLVPQMTILDGEIVYSQTDFNLF